MDSKYKRLTADEALLTDEVVLAQAWKKADAHLRQHSWLADVLDLELTAASLPEKLKIWADDMKVGDSKSRKSARLVWAPKSDKWSFQDGSRWGCSQQRESLLKLRPLAHLPIADQVAANAIMLCTADSIETMQGSTNPAHYSTALEMRKNVVSYGNRLFCDWSRDDKGRLVARNRWSSSNIYSKYFEDYERFLKRPSTVCREEQLKANSQKLFVVSMDLTSFFDNIPQDEIVERLRTSYQAGTATVLANNQEDQPHEQIFWDRAKKLLNWRWDNKDVNERETPTLGVPQGLAAGGYFANAYMQSFDNCFMRVVEGTRKKNYVPIGTRRMLIHDYCRYVDDIRMVVSLSLEDSKNISAWLEDFNHYVNGVLKDAFGSSTKLSLNAAKSKATPWEDMAGQGKTSQIIMGIKEQISSAPDPITLVQATGSLNQLLQLADAFESDSAMEPSVEEPSNHLDLASISKPTGDVKDETIKRFAANRLRSVLRLRRTMADPRKNVFTGQSFASVSEQELVDHEMESTARKLISCWSRNPSLVTVLRCGLDLYPSVELLVPVLDALETKLDLGESDKERMVAIYVMSEIFRAGATETGLGIGVDQPENSDLGAYRSEMSRRAQYLMRRSDLPWYLQQQMALFLAVVGKPREIGDMLELSHYRGLHDVLRFENMTTHDYKQLIGYTLVARNIGADSESYVAFLAAFLGTLEDEDLKNAISTLGATDRSILKELKSASKFFKNEKVYSTFEKYSYSIPTLDSDFPIDEWPQNAFIALGSIIGHNDNPFAHENGILKLALQLIDANNSPTLGNGILSVRNISVSCDDWSKVQGPDAVLKVSIELDSSNQSSDLLDFNTAPPWCSEGLIWAYSLGRILRSAIIGSDDFTASTSSRFIRSDSTPRFTSLGSTWYRRRLGLAPILDGVGVSPVPLSPWMGQLILNLLQWPGIDLEATNSEVEFGNIENRFDLLRILNLRLQGQYSIFARRSNLPVYELPVRLAERANLENLRIAVVQSLLPAVEDISPHNPLSWKSEFRARHRAHIASMSRLLIQQLVAHASAISGNQSSRNELDLIVFPELSVHPDDMWILERLSDSTGATIFAGQTFVIGSKGSPINRGVWLIRHESSSSGRRFSKAYQGKEYPTKAELSMGIVAERPFQVLVRLDDSLSRSARLTATICFDSTDLDLAADMRAVSDGLVISAMNKDISTFDTMVQALHYHMYQPVILANSGIYGGSVGQSPYRERYDRTQSHVHGPGQPSVSIFEVDLIAFKSSFDPISKKLKKTAPAGYFGRP